MIRISAKTGKNVESVLEAIVAKIPPPKGNPNALLQALVFDSHYDSYKGVIAYVRVFEGIIGSTDTLRMMSTKVNMKPVEIGIFSPGMKPVKDCSRRGSGIYRHRLQDSA